MNHPSPFSFEHEGVLKQVPEHERHNMEITFQVAWRELSDALQHAMDLADDAESTVKDVLYGTGRFSRR